MMLDTLILVVRWLLDLLARVSRENLPPLVGVAAVVERDEKILMLSRNDGLGYSLPGGLMRWNEYVSETVVREVLEETGYEIDLTGLVGIYSGPARDPRFSSVSIVYSAVVTDGMLADSWEGRAEWVGKDRLPSSLAFDHAVVMNDYFSGLTRLS